MAKLDLYEVIENYLSYPKGSTIQLDEDTAKRLIKQGLVKAAKHTKKASGYSKKA